MTASRVLVVEDSPDVRALLVEALRDEGHEVLTAADGLAARAALAPGGAAADVDLVVLDLMLPHVDGSVLLAEIRRAGDVPVLVLSAKDAVYTKVDMLRLGADDYVTKPFSSRELMARIRAVLRRNTEEEVALPAALEAGPVRMDVERHVVTVRGENVRLPLKEFELLEVLLRNAGRVLTRMQLIDRVWGADYVGDTKTLDVHIKRLRAKVEENPSRPKYIVTVRGLGYKFEPVTAAVD